MNRNEKKRDPEEVLKEIENSPVMAAAFVVAAIAMVFFSIAMRQFYDASGYVLHDIAGLGESSMLATLLLMLAVISGQYFVGSKWLKSRVSVGVRATISLVWLMIYLTAGVLALLAGVECLVALGGLG